MLRVGFSLFDVKSSGRWLFSDSKLAYVSAVPLPALTEYALPLAFGFLEKSVGSSSILSELINPHISAGNLKFETFLFIW